MRAAPALAAMERAARELALVGMHKTAADLRAKRAEFAAFVGTVDESPAHPERSADKAPAEPLADRRRLLPMGVLRAIKLAEIKLMEHPNLFTATDLKAAGDRVESLMDAAIAITKFNSSEPTIAVRTSDIARLRAAILDMWPHA